MESLKNIFRTLGLPLGLVAVIVAVLAWMGTPIEKIEVAAASLVGLQLCVSFLIDVLKYAGVVNDGTSGKWSAAINLITIIALAIYLKWFPYVDVYAVDSQLLQITKLLIPIFAYITQMLGTKAVHQVAVKARLTYSFAR